MLSICIIFPSVSLLVNNKTVSGDCKCFRYVLFFLLSRFSSTTKLFLETASAFDMYYFSFCLASRQQQNCFWRLQVLSICIIFPSVSLLVNSKTVSGDCKCFRYVLFFLLSRFSSTAKLFLETASAFDMYYFSFCLASRQQQNCFWRLKVLSICISFHSVSLSLANNRTACGDGKCFQCVLFFIQSGLISPATELFPETASVLDMYYFSFSLA